MRQGGVNSFFRFVLGFSIFIMMSFGLTYAVASYSIAEEREEQVGAAIQAFLGKDVERQWWHRVF